MIEISDDPAVCVHAMTVALLALAPCGVTYQWAELGENCGVWKADDRTLQLDLYAPMVDQARCLQEFHTLVRDGPDHAGSWQLVRPPLRVVPSH